MKRSFFFMFLLVSACSISNPSISNPPVASGPKASLSIPTPSPVSALSTATLNGSSTPASAPFPPKPAGLQQIVAGLDNPTGLISAHDMTGRVFLLEQTGTIRILKNGTLLPSPFLDLSGLVNTNGNERGLLGLAFDPKYAENGHFFVNYTDANGDSMTARFSVSASDPDRADPASASLVLRIAHPQYSNHNGGNLVFGPDGYLYFGMGDGGGAGDPNGNSQNLGMLLGKLLRIDVSIEPYAIPPDNPFIGRSGARPEIWAYGLRNPWRFSFDSPSGDLYIADVGQDAYEEIDVQPAHDRGGENYGWNFMEGFHPYRGQAPSGLTPPVAEYDHSGGNCSVTGGYVYRGAALPQILGMYVFGDYCSGRIWLLERGAQGWQKAEWIDSGLAITSFGVDDAGELYVLDRTTGGVFLLSAQA
jgi:glucose/arabinose dehydrogenase